MQSRKEFVEYRWYKITGRSMEPQFSVGDEVLVESVPVESIRPGNIVTFLRDGMLITHRIVRKVYREGGDILGRKSRCRCENE